MATILDGKKSAKLPKKTREDYAEDALYREVWEEVNNEKTMAFLKRYGRYIIAGAIVILIAATAIQIGVRTHRANKMAIAANYEIAVANADANALANVAENASGATADLALMQAYMLSGDFAKLEKLANDGNTRDFRDLARLHVVAARGDEMSGADVEKYLAGMDTKKSPFYYSAALTIAQKYISEGNRSAAAPFLDKITNDADAPASIAGTAAGLR